MKKTIIILLAGTFLVIGNWSQSSLLAKKTETSKKADEERKLQNLAEGNSEIAEKYQCLHVTFGEHDGKTGKERSAEVCGEMYKPAKYGRTSGYTTDTKGNHTLYIRPYQDMDTDKVIEELEKTPGVVKVATQVRARLKVIKTFNFGQLDKPVRGTIRDKKEWETLWKQAGKKPPKVDFSKYLLVSYQVDIADNRNVSKPMGICAYTEGNGYSLKLMRLEILIERRGPAPKMKGIYNTSFHMVTKMD